MAQINYMKDRKGGFFWYISEYTTPHPKKYVWDDILCNPLPHKILVSIGSVWHGYTNPVRCPWFGVATAVIRLIGPIARRTKPKSTFEEWDQQVKRHHLHV